LSKQSVLEYKTKTVFSLGKGDSEIMLLNLCYCEYILVLLIFVLGGNEILTQSLKIEYPTKYTIYQRCGNGNRGAIPILGSYTGSPKQIEASFNGGPWSTICSKPTDGKFTGSLSAPVGQGTLVVRFKESPTTTASVDLVSIGDIYVIAGQSNAAGWASTAYNPLTDIPYELSMYRRNVSPNWDKLQHPTSASGNGAPWPLVMSYLSKEHNMPIGIITTAIGGAWLKQWLKSSNEHYQGMIETVRKATNGTMKIRAVLCFQGEADCNPSKEWAHLSYNGSCDKYMNSLKLLVSDMHRDMKLDTVYVGQIGNVPHIIGEDVLSNRKNIYYIRKALQDSWHEPLISPGPVTYDIALEKDGLHIHFDAPEEMIPLAKRWAAAIGQYTYHSGIGRGPTLKKAEYEADDRTVKLTFDKELKISDFKGNVGTKAEGWFFEQGKHTFTDEDIVSTLIEKNVVYIKFGVEIPLHLAVSYGIDHDGAGKKILRGLNDLPAEPFYTVRVINLNE